MVALRALFLEGLRRSRCDRPAKKTARFTRWPCLDLVGGPHQFHQAGQSDSAFSETSRSDPATRASSRGSHCPSAPQTATFDQLPGNQPRDAESQFAHSRYQRKGKSRLAGDAKKIANDKVT